MRRAKTYPNGTPRVKGITYRADRNNWRVRLYRGPRHAVHTSQHPTFEEALEMLRCVRAAPHQQIGALHVMLANDEDSDDA